MIEHSEAHFERLTSQIEQLTAALRTSRRIGIAVGIMIERNQVTAEHAFLVLADESQRTQRRLVEIADDLIRTGVFPGGTPVHPEDSAS